MQRGERDLSAHTGFTDIKACGTSVNLQVMGN